MQSKFKVGDEIEITNVNNCYFKKGIEVNAHEIYVGDRYKIINIDNSMWNSPIRIDTAKGEFWPHKDGWKLVTTTKPEPKFKVGDIVSILTSESGIDDHLKTKVGVICNINGDGNYAYSVDWSLSNDNLLQTTWTEGYLQKVKPGTPVLVLDKGDSIYALDGDTNWLFNFYGDTGINLKGKNTRVTPIVRAVALYDPYSTPIEPTEKIAAPQHMINVCGCEQQTGTKQLVKLTDDQKENLTDEQIALMELGVLDCRFRIQDPSYIIKIWYKENTDKVGKQAIKDVAAIKKQLETK